MAGRILVALAKSSVFIGAVLALLLVPIGIGTVQAQQQPPHRFGGTATLDGKAAAAGVAVAAWIDGKSVATTTTTAGGDYIIDVVQPEGASYAGKELGFSIGAAKATQKATWSLGGATLLNLAAVTTVELPLLIYRYEYPRTTAGQWASAIPAGQRGSATLTAKGEDTEVVVDLPTGAPSLLVHIHSGQCGPTLGNPVYPLTSFVGGAGKSTTTVKGVTLASLRTGGWAVNSHSVTASSTYTACGNITKLGEIPSGPQGAIGAAGAKGAAGAVGAAGPAGPAGSAGSAGAKGAPGDAGKVGAAGPAGAKGAVGDAGRAGAAGPPGGPGALSIIGIIVAAVAVVVAGAVLMMRRNPAS